MKEYGLVQGKSCYNRFYLYRDIKTNNILLDLSQGYDLPEVVISDFGCCLADKSVGLSVPFRTYDTDRGGNAALTAPEISTAVPGAWKYLNFKKSDAWSVGAISYEIFGSRNPFYGRSNGHLDSRTYKECDLPNIEGVNHIIQSVIKQLLRRNPEQV
jgi:PTEN induced putative kinase 1